MKLLLIPYMMAQLAVGAPPAPIDVHYMPLGEKVYLPSARAWGKGFNLTDYKLLLQMDGDLWTANHQLELYSDIELKYVTIIEQKDGIIATLESDKVILNTRAERLEGKWQTAEKDLVDAAGGPIWPYVLAAGGAVLGIVGLTLYLSTRGD